MIFRFRLDALRPGQWIKSGFCFAAVVFSGHGWNIVAWIQVAPIAAFFVFVASAGYLFNDVVNRIEDLSHPRKQRRPIAAGNITPGYALLMAGLFALSGLFLGLLFYGPSLAWYWLLACILVSAAYSLVFQAVSRDRRDDNRIGICTPGYCWCLCAGHALPGGRPICLAMPVEHPSVVSSSSRRQLSIRFI